MKALLRAKANTELLDDKGFTALRYAEAKGQTATAELIWQHVAPPQPIATAPAAPPDAGEPAVSSPASPPLEILSSRSCEARCRWWPSGLAREGWWTRSSLLTVPMVGPRPQPCCCMSPQPTTTWRS